MGRIFKIEAIETWQSYAEDVIGVCGLVLSVVLLALYAPIFTTAFQEPWVKLAWYALLAYPVLCLIRLGWLHFKPISKFFGWANMGMDFAFLALFALVLKAASDTSSMAMTSSVYGFCFALMALQALRLRRWQVLSLGVASTVMLVFLGNISPSKIGAITTFSGFLFFLVAKGESLLSTAIDNLTADEKLQQAKQTMAMKSKVIGTMSQELKTPMSGVLSMSTALRRTSLDAEQKKYVDALEESGHALLTAIENIKEFTQLESGDLKAQTKTFDFTQLVESVAEKFGPKARQKELDLLLDISPDSETNIIGSEKRLRQILSSLVDNAIKFTPAGYVALKVSCKALDSKVAVLSVCVQDSGIGMSPEKIELLLGYTSEGGETEHPSRSSRGLGLLIVQMLLKVQGEKLVIESTPGAGAAVSFSMHVPYKKTKQTPHPILGLRRSPSDLKILIVDDSSVGAEMLQAQLNATGIMPQIVNDAQSACAAINAAHSSGMPYRVALIDYDMPEFDGLKLAKLIRTREELNKMKLIILSSSPEANVKSEFAKLGVTTYLEKPMTQLAIKDAIFEAMTGKAASSATQRDAA